MTTDSLEIERRWLMDGFPDDAGLPCVQRAAVRQGYLATAPTVRIRESVWEAAPEPKQASKAGSTEYSLCCKGKGQLVRTEIELPLAKVDFDRLCALLGHALVTKRHRVYALPGGERLEVSLVDEGQPTAFYYAEVEFTSVEAANAFIAPDCLGEEKTQDASFGMGAYWRRTRGAQG